ncbi:hypothetical protein C2S52_011303 [Perilla frutescens var. hirtella]|nr:hypothetical protein C2S52_011303 [Perilla frutescens var. hirtella]
MEPDESRGLAGPREKEWRHLQMFGLQQRHLSPPKLLEKEVGKAAPKRKVGEFDTDGEKNKKKRIMAHLRRFSRTGNLSHRDSTAESKSEPVKDANNGRFEKEDTCSNVTLNEIGANLKELLLRVASIERVLRSCKSFMNVEEKLPPKKGPELGVPDDQSEQLEEDVVVGSPSLRKGSGSRVPKSGKSAARKLFKPNPSMYDPLDVSYMARDVKPFQDWHDKARWRRMGWLCDEHIDALTNLLLFKYNQAKERFLSGWALMELLGTGILMHEDLQNVSGTLMDYVEGKLPREGGLPWAEATKLIGIANVNKNHWVYYSILLEEQRIVVYDSRSKYSDWALISQQFENMSRFVSLMCQIVGIWSQKHKKKALKSVWDV